jgi:MFS family permease
VLLLGASYAATDGVLAALAAERLPRESRGRGLALLATTSSLARLAGSVGFGALWHATGFGMAAAAFAALLVGAILLSTRLLAPVRDTK